MDAQVEIQRLREKVAILEAELDSLKGGAKEKSEKVGDESNQQVTKEDEQLRHHQDEAAIGKVEQKLSKMEVARYGRQLIIPEIGMTGQTRLKNTKVLIVGAGGLGAPVALYLASCGIGHLGIVDYDDVELGNLHRQVIHDEGKLKLPKVQSAAESVRRLNRNCSCTPYHMLLDSTNALPLIQKYDIVVDATDNVATRYLLNDACVLSGKVLVSGSALRLEGQLTVYNYGDGPCYRCLFPTPPPPETVTNCSDGGVLGVVPGIIGTIQALEVIKLALGLTPNYAQKLMLFDALTGTFRVVKLRGRSKTCAINGDSPSIHSLIDYEQFCRAGPHDKSVAQTLLSPNERITCAELHKIRSSENSPHLVLDVREKVQYEICSLSGSLNIPLKQLPEHLGEIEEKKVPVYVICRRGNDSQIATKMLQEKFPGMQVKDVVGGLYRWALEIDDHFPIY